MLAATVTVTLSTNQTKGEFSHVQNINKEIIRNAIERFNQGNLEGYLELYDENATLHFLPPELPQGIGGAITLQPLLEARALGYRHAVLFSTEMGIRVYQRLGFRLTEALINRYLWAERIAPSRRFFVAKGS